MSAYYNELDPEKAQWIRELITAGVIAPGDVDERSITDVRPGDLRGYTQCHWFAGIGVWSYALRLAGWPDSEPVWTGSCPCQPFSAAGKQEGFADARHLWPEWFRLIRGCRPPVLFGEQVAASIRGISREKANLPELQGREILFRVLRELQGESARKLHRVREGAGAVAQEISAGSSLATLSGLANQEARSCAGECGQVQGEEARTTLHARPRGHSGADRPWVLRNNGDSVRSYQASLMECAIAGPDRPDEGLHARERACDLVFLECDGERLGHTEGRGGGQRDPRRAYKAQRRVDRIFDGCFETKLGESWLDLIRRDLEGASYTLGPAVLGAHSAGAPHIRQRLYFCAYAQHDGHAATDGLREATESSFAAGTFGLGEPARSGDDCERADAPDARCDDAGQHGRRPSLFAARPEQCSGIGKCTDADSQRREQISEPERRSGIAGVESQGRDGRPVHHGQCALPGELCDPTLRGFAMHGSTSGSTGYAALASESGGGIESCSHAELSPCSCNGQRCGQALPQPETEGTPVRCEPLREWRGPGWLGPRTARSVSQAGATRGFWGDCDWWYGRDGKYRPIGPGLQPLATGSAARVLRLRGYGDAICAESAAHFIQAAQEARSVMQEDAATEAGEFLLASSGSKKEILLTRRDDTQNETTDRKTSPTVVAS